MEELGEKEARARPPPACLWPCHWAPASSLWGTIPRGCPRRTARSRKWRSPPQSPWHPSEASGDQWRGLCEGKETASDDSFCKSQRISTDLVIDLHGCFLWRRKEPQDCPLFSLPCEHGPLVLRRGEQVARERAAISRGPFALICKVSEKSVLHLLFCQASSSSCYLRYVTSKITKTLIGGGLGPLNHRACPIHKHFCTFQKCQPEASRLPSSVWNAHTAELFFFVSKLYSYLKNFFKGL